MAIFSLLAGFSINQQEELISKLPVLSYGSNEVIFEKGDQTTDLYFILEGKVKSLNYGAKGDLVWFRSREEGEMFGYYSALTNEPRTAHMITDKKTRLAKMTQDEFFVLLSDFPEVSLQMMKALAKLLRMETNRITDMTTLSAEKRICKNLLAESALEHQDIIAIPSRLEYASFLGITRETLSRILNKFVKEGYIDVSKKNVKILDRHKMEAKVFDFSS